MTKPKIKWHQSVITVLIGLGLTLITSIVLAQEQPGSQGSSGTGMAISPPTFELTGNPGDVIDNTIKLTNLSNRPITIGVDRRNFTAVGEEGAVGLTDEETTFSLASWITVSPSEVMIEPGQSQIFSFRTSVPYNAEPGGHFGSVIFKTGGQTPGSSGAAVAQEVASLILLRVAGQTTVSGEILSFTTNKSFYDYGPIDFEARVINEGSVHIKPIGSITINNMFGKQVDKIAIEPKNVLPDATRRIPASWNKKYLIGKYTATVVFSYGTNGETMIKSTTFSGFPVKEGGIILAALLILLAILFKMRKRLRLAFKILFGNYKA